MIYLPKDTFRNLNVKDIDNYYLKLYKVPYFDDKNKKFRFFVPKGKGQPEIDNYSTDFSTVDFESLLKRIESSLNSLGMFVRSMKFGTDWRLIVGLGGASVYETSMTLHHIYGIPYIPGSAVKGILRSWTILRFFENEENRALDNCGFCQIFGSPLKSALGDYKGAVRFFDAFPVQRPTVSLDIMNPHYGPYYSEGKAPTDDNDPKPITFLTVKNTTFQFFVGIEASKNQGIETEPFTGKTPLDVVTELLPEALFWHGIGAKTAVGYGYMSPMEERT